MKNVINLLFCLGYFIACAPSNSSISKVTILFYKEDKSLDSVEVNDKKEIQIIENFISSKTELVEKLPVKYFLNIRYKSGTVEEYSGNGCILKDKSTYTNPDKNIQVSYLLLINSKLPSYLHQQ